MDGIDAHQHFWRFDSDLYDWITTDMDVIRRDFLPADIEPLLNTQGFSGCVSIQARQDERESYQLLKWAEEYDFIKGVVGWIDLRDKKVEHRLDQMTKNPYLKGIRHIVQSEVDNQFLLKEDFKRGISLLKKYQLTYDILIYPHQLPASIEFVSYFPDQPFVVDHLAKPLIKAESVEPWATHMRTLAQYPQVYCKLSGMVTEADWNNWQTDDFEVYIDIVLEAFGSERCMIGSDWPVCLLAASYDEVINVATHYVERLSLNEQREIKGETARAFYRLDTL